jgi:hypothetical protein
MTKLPTETGAFDLVCTPDWLYYRVQMTRLRHVPYAYFKADQVQNVAVSEDEFNQVKYRGPSAPAEVGEEVVYLPTGNTLRCFYQESVIREFTPTGDLVRAMPSTEAMTSIYSIAVDRDGHLWTAEPSFHRVAQYHATTGQRLFALGGDWDPGEFNHPEDVTIYGEHAFISDMGNQRVVRLNTRTHQFGTYRLFEQRVWQYRRFQQRELVRLDNGIYLL